MTMHEMAKSRDSSFRQMSLPEFSQHMNQATGSNRFDAGASSGMGALIKQSETGLEQTLQPAAKFTGDIGEKIGGVFGKTGGEIGRGVGESLPRQAATMLPLIAEAAAPEASIPAALLTATGLGSQAAETYTKTGSPVAAAISAASLPLMGWAGRKAAAASLPLAESAGRAVEGLAGPLWGSVARAGAIQGGRTLGEITAMEASSQAESLTMGQGLYNPLTLRHAVETLANVLPYKALDVSGFVDDVKAGVQRSDNATTMAALGVHNQIKANLTSKMEGAATTARREQQTPQPPNSPTAPYQAEQLQLPGLEGATRAKFVPSTPFGSKSEEETRGGTEKPFGLNPTPTPEGPKLPGNSLLQKMPTVIPKDEWDVLKSAGIEEFLKGKRVSPQELNAWVKENGPKVVIKTAGEGAQHPDTKAFNDFQHQFFDSQPQEIKDEILDVVEGRQTVEEMRSKLGIAPGKSEFIDSVQKYNDLFQKSAKTSFNEREANWASITPTDVTGKGYVEGAVTIPLPKAAKYEKPLYPGAATHDISLAKFPSTHSFPPNTLGWFRGYMDTDPTDNKKVFHVVEVQSDWAQRARQSEGKGWTTPTDPLLKDWERLTLKAAIHHALSQGADEITLSDAQTAMMTEGHDTIIHQARAEVDSANDDRRGSSYDKNVAINQLRSSYSRSGAKFELQNNKVVMTREPFTEGMGLHYGTTGPRILKELTGYEGKERGLGTHQKAMGGYSNTGTGEPQPRSNLVFKNPDGTPKTSITAKSYPLDKAFKYLTEQGGYHLMAKDKIATHLEQLARKDVPQDQLVQAGLNLKHLPIKKGESLYDAAARDAGLDPTKLNTHDPQALLKGITEFGKSVYSTLGYAEQITSYLVGNLQKVASRFATAFGGTRVVESTDANFSTSPRGENWKSVIGLVRKAGFGDDLYEHFGHLWATGHELVHQLEFAAAGKDDSVPEGMRKSYLDALDKAKLLDPQEMQETIGAMIRGLTGDRKFAEDTSRFYGEFYKDPNEGASEYVADFAGLVAMGAGHPAGTRHISDLAFFGNKETQGFVATISKTLSQVFEVLSQAARKLVGKSTVLDDLYEATNKMLDSKSKTDSALNGFLGWATRFATGVDDPPPVTSYDQIEKWRERVEGFDGHATKTMWPFPSKKNADPDLRDEAERAMSRTVAGGKTLSFWQTLIPMRQLVREIPAFEPAVDLAHMKDSMAKQLLMGLYEPFSKDGKIDVGLVRAVGKEGSPMNSAHRDIALAENKAAKQLDRSEKEKLPSYARLSEDQKNKVDRFLQAESVAAQQAAHTLVEHQKLRHVATVAKVIQSYLKSMDMESADGLGSNYVNMVFNEEPVAGESPPEAQERQQAFAQAVQGVNKAGLPQETTASLLDLTHDLHDSFKTFQKQMLGDDLSGKPYYHSETRSREFHVAWTDKNDVAHYEDYDDKTGAQKRIDEIQKSGLRVMSMRKSDIGQRFQGVPTDMLNAYKQADDVAYQSALKHLVASDPDYSRFVEELRGMFQPGEGAAAQRLSPYLRERKFVEGREKLNMVETMIHYLGSVAHGRAKAYVGDRMGLALNSPGLRDNNNYYNAAKTYLQETVSPQGREFTKLKNLVFLNYLGFNPSSNAIVFLHQALRHAPELVRQGFGIGEAYAAMGRSFLTVGKARLEKGYKDPELGNAVAQAHGLLDRSQASEIYNEEDMARLNVHSLIEGKGSVVDAKALLSNGLYHLTKMARNVYGISTEFNSEAAFVSAYSLAKGRGASPEKAQKFAEDTIKTTTIPGGVANRPLELQGLGKMRGEGGLFYNLMSYEMGALASMARYGREAIGTLPTETRGLAGKSFALMLGTQLLMGGTLGLPFVDGLMSIIDNMFPQAQVRKNLRQAFQNLVPNDAEMGHVVADGAMRGAINMGALGLGTRLELGRLFNVDPKTGKWDMSEELLGPLGSLINSWTRSAQLAGQGRWDQAAIAASPNGIKGLLKMYVDQGAMRDPESRLVYQPTSGERILEGLGFRTRRMTDYYEEQQLKAQSELAASQEQQEFHRRLGQQLLQGDYQGVRSALLDRQRTSPPGTYDVLAGTKAVVQSAQDQSLPVDPTRSGSRVNASQISQVGQLFDRPQVPSEMQRLQQRIALQTHLGIPGAMGAAPTEFREAAMTDQVMQQNPTLSRVEALKMVERVLNPRRYGLSYGPQALGSPTP
jgi:hypothetical protein